MKPLIFKRNIITVILTGFYLFGIIFHLWNKTGPLVTGLTEITLYVCNALIIIYYFLINKENQNAFTWLLLTVFITLILEIIGVDTGKIFGTYYYGDTMRLKIRGVPIIIGINWAILILASFEISRLISPKKNLIPILAGIIIVIFDYVMEPVAMKLDYWQWKNNIIPFQNYLIWFLLAVQFSYLINFLKIKTSLRILVVYFCLQLLFFIALNLFLD